MIAGPQTRMRPTDGFFLSTTRLFGEEQFPVTAFRKDYDGKD